MIREVHGLGGFMGRAPLKENRTLRCVDSNET